MRSEFDDGCPFINTIRHVKGIEGLNKKCEKWASKDPVTAIGNGVPMGKGKINLDFSVPSNLSFPYMFLKLTSIWEESKSKKKVYNSIFVSVTFP